MRNPEAEAPADELVSDSWSDAHYVESVVATARVFDGVGVVANSVGLFRPGSVADLNATLGADVRGVLATTQAARWKKRVSNDDRGGRTVGFGSSLVNWTRVFGHGLPVSCKQL